MGAIIMATAAMTACGGGGEEASGQPVTTAADDRSRAEIDTAMVRCLQDAGYSARVSDVPAGGVEWESGDNAAQADVAYERCMDDLIDDGVLPPPEVMTPERLSDLYDHELDVVACLEDHGYEVPEPPSREVFIETQAEWRAYLTLPVMSDEEFEQLNADCPQQ